MATPKEMMYAKAAKTLIPALERRQFTAEYCATAAEAKQAVLAQIGPEDTVGWGGSLTMQQLGIADALHARGQKCFDRDIAPTKEEAQEAMRLSHWADVFLMSANAVSRDGCLVNMDGSGNRVSSLICGPKKVVVAVSMNKVCTTVEDAIERVRHVAAPMNAQRFAGDSPCRRTGQCFDCVSPDCICANLVVTRLSRIPGRIHVILIGEELGM